ncbi:MFS transporter [Kallotenue papyrolyticum]|uniref:MFS transporter n=1 Tax=Kallotenue papyrolyticum TaxID=1325125 RepID=UPI00046F1D5E|nr:MFS transporter [Kallotenue papyrolyticum]
MRRQTTASRWLQWSYWWYYAAIGCLIPYLALYYRVLQLSGLQIGALIAVLPLGTALFAPLWGALADAFSAHRLVLRLALLLAALAALLLTWARSFETLLGVILLLSISAAGAPPLLDGYAMLISEREGRSYGRLRVWGSFGFIAAVWIVGWLMRERISTIFLIAYALSLLLAGLATVGLPPLRPRIAQPVWQGVHTLLRDRAVGALLLTAFLTTTSGSMLSNFFSVYLVEIGGDARMVGTASALAAISELPVLIFGAWLLERFASQRVLLLAILVYLLRFGLYSLPPAPGWVLAIQLLHGLSFGAYLMASVTLAYQLAGRERAATVQGLLTSSSFGFGAILGSLLGGLLLDRVGAVGLFRVGTLGLVLALLVYLVTLHWLAAPQSGTVQHRVERCFGSEG